MVRLVMSSEVGQMLGGVSRQRVWQISNTTGFPRPIGVLRGGRVWDEGEVREWISTHRPQDSDEP